MSEVVLKQRLLTITCVIKKIKLLSPAKKYQNSKATKAKSCKSITQPLVLSFKLARLFPVFWFWLNCLNLIEKSEKFEKVKKKKIIITGLKTLKKECKYKRM